MKKARGLQPDTGQERNRKMNHTLREGSANGANETSHSKPKNGLPVAAEGRMEPFPVDDLPPVVSDYVAAAAKALAVDPAMVAVPLLATLGGCIGNTRRILLKKGWTESACIWACVVADSGSAKSPALDAATRFLMRRQYQEHARWERAMSEWEQEKLTAKAKAAAEKKPPPAEPPAPKLTQLFCSDFTMEKLCAMLASHPRGLVSVQAELGGLFGGMNAYRGGRGADRENLLKMYSGESLKIDRLGRGTMIVTSPFLSVVGCCTPASLRSALMAENNESNGLSARFLLCRPPRQLRKWTEAEIPEETAERLGNLVDELLDLPQVKGDEGEFKPVFLPLQKRAKRVWADWVNRHNCEMMRFSGPVAGAFSKLEATCARIALILQSADRPSAGSISEFWMAAACRITDWAKSEQVRFWLDAKASDRFAEQQRLTEWIRGRGGRVTATNVQHNFRPRPANTEAAYKLLRDLVGQGIGRMELIPTGGRPADTFILNDAAKGSTETTEETDPAVADTEETDLDSIPF
jgi:hypothetical protein